jgi:GntR family transcriptional regulator, rspAB operon transcriptional repressor
MSSSSNISVDRKFLKDQAYERIKEEILTGSLSSGVLLSERSLAERFQFGKAPIRDAINRLRQENYLSVTPQLGILVRQLTPQDIADTFEAREIIEPQVVKRLAGRLSAASRSILEKNLKHQLKSIDRGKAIEFVKWDVDFHMELVRAHGNGDLVRMMERICERTFQVITSAFDGRLSALTQAYKSHKSILTAVIRGDASLAESRLSEHIADTRKLRVSVERRAIV